MYKLESINNSNIRMIKNFDLNKEYIEDLKDICSNRNIIKRILMSKNIKYIKKDNSYIGFIWYSRPYNKTYRVHCLKFDREHSTLSNYSYLFNGFNDAFTIIIGDNNNLDKELMMDLGFNVERAIIEMSLQIKERVTTRSVEGVGFRVFCNGIDEKNRCRVQNLVFHAVNRQAMEEEDVVFERLQKYYIPEGCIFITLNGEDIGYGQLVIKDEKIYLANFGIMPTYRHKGYGRMLLREILRKAYELNFTRVHLRCDLQNTEAISLYKSQGFVPGNIYYQYRKNVDVT